MSERKIRAFRAITSHRVNACNEAIDIEILDPPNNESGASFEYDLLVRRPDGSVELSCALEFHVGPIVDGTNGVTHEALLAILIDRLECFQSGKFACVENQRALDALKVARLHLGSRTQRRMDEGTEGTHAPDAEPHPPCLGLE